MASNKITVTVNTRWAMLWLRLLRLIAPVLVPFAGADRVLSWARAGAMRLIRVRAG